MIALRQIHAPWIALAAICCLGVAVPVTAAEPDVEIDSLSAEVWYGPTVQWHIGVRYRVEVETEDAPDEGPFLIRFTLTEEGRAVLDNRQQPVVIEMEMDQIERSDDKKTIYAEVFTIDLPKDKLVRGQKVRVRASVFAGNGPSLDTKEVKAKFRSTPPEPNP